MNYIEEENDGILRPVSLSTIVRREMEAFKAGLAKEPAEKVYKAWKEISFKERLAEIFENSAEISWNTEDFLKNKENPVDFVFRLCNLFEIKEVNEELIGWLNCVLTADLPRQ